MMAVTWQTLPDVNLYLFFLDNFCRVLWPYHLLVKPIL